MKNIVLTRNETLALLAPDLNEGQITLLKKVLDLAFPSILPQAREIVEEAWRTTPVGDSQLIKAIKAIRAWSDQGKRAGDFEAEGYETTYSPATKEHMLSLAGAKKFVEDTMK